MATKTADTLTTTIKRTKALKGPTRHTPDILLLAVIVLIVAFVVVMVYSASHSDAMNTTGVPFQFAKKP